MDVISRVHVTLGNGISIITFRKCITTSTFKIRNCVFSMYRELFDSFSDISLHIVLLLKLRHIYNNVTLSGCIHPPMCMYVL